MAAKPSDSIDQKDISFLDELLNNASHIKDTDIREYQKRAFEYQLECLKIEIDLIERSISRSQNIELNVKNFAVIAWAAIVTVFLGQDKIRSLVGITALIPFIFWFIDAWWISRGRGSRLRLRKISEFLNSHNFVDSFRKQQIVGITVLDIGGRSYLGTTEYERVSSFKRIIWYKEIFVLYGGLITVSIIIEIIVLLFL